jgi:hypothetical protein
MTVETFERLLQLRDRYRMEFGKLCQKLLALAFHEAGYEIMVERGVQGVDIDVAGDGERYAIEVKTTDGEAVAFERKDADGLAARGQDGYRPVLAILQIKLFADWLLVSADRLAPKQWPVEGLRARRLHALEQRVGPRFDEAVAAHAAGALDGGQAYLDAILRTIARG